MAEQNYDEVSEFVSGVLKKGEEANVEITPAEREAWMTSLRETNIDWAATIGAVWVKLTTSGVPSEIAAQLIRDDNWVFQCGIMDYSETPIPPGACEHDG